MMHFISVPSVKGRSIGLLDIWSMPPHLQPHGGHGMVRMEESSTVWIGEL